MQPDRTTPAAAPSPAPAPAPARQPTTEEVFLRCVGSCGYRPADLSLDDRLADLDFESLRFVQLVVLLETSLDIEFADERLDYQGFERLRDVLTYVEALVTRSSD